MSATPAPDAGAGADAVLGALGDPTRRAVLQAVAERGPLTATELAAPAGISRQAMSKHLGLLEQAGLVHGERVGRETRYEIVAGLARPRGGLARPGGRRVGLPPRSPAAAPGRRLRSQSQGGTAWVGAAITTASS